MSKVKLSSFTVIGVLLLVFLIGVISYGCAANKNLKNADSTLVKNSNNTKDNSNSISTHKKEASHVEPNALTTTSNIDNDSPLLLDERTMPLESVDNIDDGVRPETKRILQSKFSNQAELETALNGASILQDYLNRPNQDAIAMIKRYDCSVLSLTQADQNLIQSLTFDTDARKNKIKNGLKDYKPAVSIEIQIDNQGNAISPCSIIE